MNDGRTKAEAFAAHVQNYPEWDAKCGQIANESATWYVKAKRGDEMLDITWVDGKITRANQPVHYVDGKPRKLKNASEARQVIARPAGTAQAPRPSKPAVRPALAAAKSAPTGSDKVLRMPLPFAMDDPDEVIAASLVGRTVTWLRRGLAEPVTVKVTDRADKVRVYKASGGAPWRIASFFEERGPQFDIYLSSILDVT